MQIWLKHFMLFACDFSGFILISGFVTNLPFFYKEEKYMYSVAAKGKKEVQYMYM